MEIQQSTRERLSCLRQATCFSWRAARGISEPTGEQLYQAAEMKSLVDAPTCSPLYKFYSEPLSSSLDFSFQYSITCLKRLLSGEEPCQFLPHSEHYLTLDVLLKCIELIDEVLDLSIWNAMYLLNTSSL